MDLDFWERFGRESCMDLDSWDYFVREIENGS